MNTRTALTLLAACLAYAALASDCRASELTVGLHTVSAHLPAQPGQNNQNFGGYIRTDDFQVGVYHNTHERTTAYAAAIIPVGPIEVLVGAATGYQKKCQAELYETGTYVKETILPDGSRRVEKGKTFEERERCVGHSRGALAPLLVLSWAPPVQLLGAQPRVMVVPPTHKAGAVVHLSVEWAI